MSRRIVIDELEFEVPYGRLAAKTWHEETDECKRVLVLHGWMDNAGSFDNIMPKLKHKDGLYVVALDLPGHGKSSQLPPGSSYSDMNIVMEIRRCLRELEWTQPIPKKLVNGASSPRLGGGAGSPRVGGARANPGGMVHSASSNSIGDPANAPPQRKRFTIVGHSLGAGLALWYASLYPEDVDEVVVLDFIKARTPPMDDLLADTAETIDQFIDTVPSRSPFASPVLGKASISSSGSHAGGGGALSHSTSGLSNASSKQPDRGQVVVSQEAAIIATIEAHKMLGALTRDDAKCLLKRSTVAISTPPNSVIYSRDLRLQCMLNLRENFEVQQLMFARVRCHVLIIVGRHGMYADDALFRDRMEDMQEFYRQRAKSFHLQWINADHYLHMNRPEETAAIINKYLENPEGYQISN